MERFKSQVVLSELPTGEIVCSNNWPLSVTVELTVKGEGGFDLLESHGGGARKPRSLHVLPAFSADVQLAVVVRKSLAATWQVEYRGAFGAGGAAHDESVRYKWPFEGPGECESAFGTDASKEGYHTVCFALYEDTPVAAARRGIVLLCDGGTVQVCHGDGSVATYGGLSSVAVHEGQAVKERETLGGSSARLSMCITLPLGNPGSPKRVPFVFDNGTPAGCEAVAGVTYENAAPASRGPAVKSGPMKMAAKKGGAKVGPKKVVKQQGGGVEGGAVPPPPTRMASSGNIGLNSPAVSRASSAATPSPALSRNSSAAIPSPAVSRPPPGVASPMVARHAPAASAPPASAPNEDWSGTYASPALLPVKPKPPMVNRSSRPESPQVQRHAQLQHIPIEQAQAPPGVNPSMMPGVRSAPPSRALHPELYDQAGKAAAADPNAPVVHDSMKPGYQREFDLVEETKRTFDPRRHNPIKNTSKKLAVATPSGADLKQKLKGFTMF